MVLIRNAKKPLQYSLVALSFFVLLLSSFLVNSFLRTSQEDYRPVNAAVIPTPSSITPSPTKMPVPYR